MSELPALIGGKYRPVRVIGRGGMGIVYEVVHENTGEHLALKLLLARSRLAPDLVERFRREARATTSVKSDHVVRVTDADIAPELDGAPFLVMELLEGQNLEELCLERRPSSEESVEWLRQIARALDKAHRQRIVHRDLKPENLFLVKREDVPPIVKVLDFGIAKIIGETGPETVSGQILGTPRYMAPEQAGQGAKEISAASDRYVLGLIAFRLLSGRHYFDEDNVMKLLLDVGRGPTIAPSSLGCASGPSFDAWFARACALDPALRFESCFEQIEALAEAVGLSAPTDASSRRHSPASDGQVSRATNLERAPTLEASIVSGRPSGVGSPHRSLFLAAGVLGAGILAVFFGLRRVQPAVDDRSSAIATSSPAPAGSPTATPESGSGAPPRGEGFDAASNNSTATPSVVSSASASAKPRRTPVAPGSVRGRAPAAKPTPKDSVWDEP